MALMQNAFALIFPSTYYEGFPMVIVEAYAVGLIVIASNLGSMTTLIEDRVTGLHFDAGNAEGLVDQVHWLVNHPEQCQTMRQQARRAFETQFTAERNYDMLMAIYDELID